MGTLWRAYLRGLISSRAKNNPALQYAEGEDQHNNLLRESWIGKLQVDDCRNQVEP
jgi:hypothetical protein